MTIDGNACDCDDGKHYKGVGAARQGRIDSQQMWKTFTTIRRNYLGWEYVLGRKRLTIHSETGMGMGALHGAGGILKNLVSWGFCSVFLLLVVVEVLR